MRVASGPVAAGLSPYVRLSSVAQSGTAVPLLLSPFHKSAVDFRVRRAGNSGYLARIGVSVVGWAETGNPSPKEEESGDATV